MKHLKLITILSLVFVFSFTSLLQAQHENNKDLLSLEADLHLRQETMSKNFITAHYAVGRLKGDYADWLNNKGNYESTSFMPKFGKGLLRLAKFGLADWWISSHIKMLNHELSGHAVSSITSDKFEISEMSLPFNYFIGRFHYLTKPSLAIIDADAFVAIKLKAGYSLREDDLSLLSISGINASSTLRQNVERDWFNSEKMHYHQSLLILQSHYDIFTYCFAAEYGQGNDVSDYLNMVNRLHVKMPDSLLKASNSKLLIDYAEKNYKFKIDDVRQVAYINTLGDPNLYVALYNIFYSYLIKGQPISDYKMIGFKNIKFMPSVGGHLSPWGIQYFGQAHVEVNNKKFAGTYRFGKNDYGDSFKGYGIRAFNLIENEQFRLGANVEVFKQPQLILGKKLEQGETYTANVVSGGAGLMASASVDYKLLNTKTPLYLTSTLGYKTAGFIPGQTIDQAPIITLGVSFDIMK